MLSPTTAARVLGARGGKARAEKLTAEERRAISSAGGRRRAELARCPACGRRGLITVVSRKYHAEVCPARLAALQGRLVKAAMRHVEMLTASVEIGRIYDGKVTSVKDFGAFVEILPGRDGLCHISELSDEYVSSVADVCKVGDPMKVKVISVDEQDRVKLSRKVAMKELAAASEPAAESSD